MWAISNSGGLFRYDTEKDCFEPVNKKYGIDGDKVFAISEDNYGHLWLNSDECIIRLIFDDKGKTFVTHFTEEDGVQNASFFPNSVFKYKDEMYFGANNGLISFIPKRDININDTSKRKLLLQISSQMVYHIPISTLLKELVYHPSHHAIHEQLRFQAI